MKRPEVKAPSHNNEPKKVTRDEAQSQIRRMRDRDAEMVTGIFKNLENPASAGGRGAVMFSFKKYPGDPFLQYELCDGERYTIPRGVAHHLNNNCFYREYQHLPGEFGTQGIRQGIADGRLHTNNVQMSKKVHRYAFHSLEYMDDDRDMIQTNLVEVTITP